MLPARNRKDLDEVPAEILARTKILYLNYPNNPTAAIASREYLAKTVRQCREHDILLGAVGAFYHFRRNELLKAIMNVLGGPSGTNGRRHQDP